MAEGPDVTVDTHSLLLSLAGALDDELLGWCRELVAVGESDYAVELVTAAVRADRVRLPPGPREQLQDAALHRHLLGRDEALPPADTSGRGRHRFVADPAAGGFPTPAPEHSPEHALSQVPRRMLRNCELLLSWRATPAGAAPGPLPHPVVLIETDEHEGADVLAYQVGEVLMRAGVFASVEVFSARTDLGDYHRAALAEARRVTPDAEPGDEPGRPGPRGGRGPGGPGGNGLDPRGPEGGPRGGDPRPGVPAGPETSRSMSLRPVDRVIAARGSVTRRPRPDQPESRLDGADRSDVGFDEIASGLTFDRPHPDEEGYRERAAPPREEAPEGPRAPRRVGTPRPTPRAAGPDRPTPPRGAATPPAGPAKRPLPRGSDDPSLSDVEQRLLRQLHEELASREDPASGSVSDSRAFRAANGGTNGGAAPNGTGGTPSNGGPARKPRPHRGEPPAGGAG